MIRNRIPVNFWFYFFISQNINQKGNMQKNRSIILFGQKLRKCIIVRLELEGPLVSETSVSAYELGMKHCVQVVKHYHITAWFFV